MKAWKMFFLFKWVIFRFHVSFLGCNGYINPYYQLDAVYPLAQKNQWEFLGPKHTPSSPGGRDGRDGMWYVE